MTEKKPIDVIRAPKVRQNTHEGYPKIKRAGYALDRMPRHLDEALAPVTKAGFTGHEEMAAEVLKAAPEVGKLTQRIASLRAYVRRILSVGRRTGLQEPNAQVELFVDARESAADLAEREEEKKNFEELIRETRGRTGDDWLAGAPNQELKGSIGEGEPMGGTVDQDTQLETKYSFQELAVINGDAKELFIGRKGGGSAVQLERRDLGAEHARVVLSQKGRYSVWKTNREAQVFVDHEPILDMHVGKFLRDGSIISFSSFPTGQILRVRITPGNKLSLEVIPGEKLVEEK